jgi:hypothetical protein
MNNQYHQDIVTTETGIVDIEHYKREASRIRSEYLLALLKSSVSFVKGLFATDKDLSEAAVNMFKVEKLAR